MNILHTKLSDKAIMAIWAAYFILAFLIYLACIGYVIMEYLHHSEPSVKIVPPAVVAMYLHPKTGRRVIRFIKNKVFAR